MRRAEARAKVLALALALEDPEQFSTDWAAILELDLADGADARRALEEAVMLLRRVAGWVADDEGRCRADVLAELGEPTAADRLDDAFDAAGLDPEEK